MSQSTDIEFMAQKRTATLLVGDGVERWTTETTSEEMRIFVLNIKIGKDDIAMAALNAA